MTEQTYDGPGEGWRKVQWDTIKDDQTYVLYSDGNEDHYWIPKEPEQTLPTEYGAYLDRIDDLWILNADGWKAIDRYGTLSEGVSRAVATYQPLRLLYKFR